MFIEKSSIISSFKFLTILFIFYMLITGVTHLKKDYESLVSQNSSTDNNNEVYQTGFEELDCKTPLFLISFAFVLGAFWNQNKIIKFGVI